MKRSTQAWRTIRIAITMVSPIDHFRTRRNKSPSLPCNPVALVPKARFCGLIVFPSTPPGGDAGVEGSPLGAVTAQHYLLLFLSHYLVHPSLRIVRLAYVHSLLPTALSKVEVPVRASFGQLAVLAPVGTRLKLEDAVAVIAALHDGAKWFQWFVA